MKSFLFVIFFTFASANDHKYSSFTCNASGKTLEIERCDGNGRKIAIVVNIKESITKANVK